VDGALLALYSFLTLSSSVLSIFLYYLDAPELISAAAILATMCIGLAFALTQLQPGSTDYSAVAGTAFVLGLIGAASDLIGGIFAAGPYGSNAELVAAGVVAAADGSGLGVTFYLLKNPT